MIRKTLNEVIGDLEKHMFTISKTDKKETSVIIKETAMRTDASKFEINFLKELFFAKCESLISKFNSVNHFGSSEEKSQHPGSILTLSDGKIEIDMTDIEKAKMVLLDMAADIINELSQRTQEDALEHFNLSKSETNSQEKIV